MWLFLKNSAIIISRDWLIPIYKYIDKELQL